MCSLTASLRSLSVCSSSRAATWFANAVSGDERGSACNGRNAGNSSVLLIRLRSGSTPPCKRQHTRPVVHVYQAPLCQTQCMPTAPAQQQTRNRHVLARRCGRCWQANDRGCCRCHRRQQQCSTITLAHVNLNILKIPHPSPTTQSPARSALWLDNVDATSSTSNTAV